MKYSFLLVSTVLGVSFLVPAAFSADLGSDLRSAPSRIVLVDAQSNVASKGAEEFIDQLAQQGIGFLGNSAISDQDRKAEFKKLLGSNFDMQTIARFSLGRYWKSANEAQRKEYMDLFKKMIVEVYSRRFADYKGQKLDVRGSRPEGASDVLVNSSIVQPSGPEVAVDWRVRKKDGQYKVVDVIVEGVSMAVTQRADFASVIQRGGGDMNVLLAHLKTH